MLIFLIPGAPRPNVFFTVSLADPCEYVPLSPGWAAQLHALQADELDMPSSVHALDKATWLLAILTEVTFDLTTLTVSCAFTDGPPIEWPLDDPACVRMLEDVLADVVLATGELEREREKELQTEREREQQTEPANKAELVPAAKPVKHKKQRSLLMSLVSSLNKLTQSVCADSSAPSGLRRTSLLTAPAPPPGRPPRVSLPLHRPPISAFLPPSRKVPLPRVPPPAPSILYQHRARSALVEVFRASIVPALRARMVPGAYRAWAAQNMLQRVEGQMTAIVQDAGGVPALGGELDLMRGALPGTGRGARRVSSSPFFDDEFDDASLTDSVSTDTDGSSVHTPVDSHSSSPFDHPEKLAAGHGPAQQLPRTPSPPVFSREDLAEYTALSAQCLRLRQVLARAEAAQLDAQHDERAFLAVLEVKSRRRAWSNRAYLGGAHYSGIGLATPFRSSPLARYEPVMPARLAEVGRTRERRQRELDVCTGEINVATLFPVCEEEEEDDMLVGGQKGGYQYGQLLGPPAITRSGEEGSLARPPIRSRTLSMHSLDLDLVLVPDSPRLQAASLPLPLAPPPALRSPPPSMNVNVNVKPMRPAMLEPRTKFALFEQVDHPERVLVDDAVEFTLAMDLPAPPPYSRVQVQTHGNVLPHVKEWDAAQSR
ncbi:hypothetical protein BKA93DRAFT_260213 [Sparassis latifolia]